MPRYVICHLSWSDFNWPAAPVTISWLISVNWDLWVRACASSKSIKFRPHSAGTVAISKDRPNQPNTSNHNRARGFDHQFYHSFTLRKMTAPVLSPPVSSSPVCMEFGWVLKLLAEFSVLIRRRSADESFPALYRASHFCRLIENDIPNITPHARNQSIELIPSGATYVFILNMTAIYSVACVVSFFY